MMIELGFTTRELAYLLGGIGGLLQQPALAGHDRVALKHLRDKLAPYISVDADVALALGLRAPEARH